MSMRFVNRNSTMTTPSTWEGLRSGKLHSVKVVVLASLPFDPKACGVNFEDVFRRRLRCREFFHAPLAPHGKKIVLLTAVFSVFLLARSPRVPPSMHAIRSRATSETSPSLQRLTRA